MTGAILTESLGTVDSCRAMFKRIYHSPLLWPRKRMPHNPSANSAEISNT